MKTPKSASKSEKGGSAHATPNSGKVSKNKNTPMSLKAKVLEKNAKMALQNALETVTMNGKKTPKGTPKKPATPQSVGAKKGSPQGTPKNAKKGGSPPPQKSPSTPQMNGGKKRKSVEGSPVNDGKKPKKTPDVSPEVKLGLKIEKLLESPQEKKKGKADSPTASPQSPQPGKKSRNRRKKGGKPADAPVAAEGPKVDKKKDKLQQNVEAKQAAVKENQNADMMKSKRQRKREAKRKLKEQNAAKLVNTVTGPFLKRTNIENAIKALLDEEKEKKATKAELLEEDKAVLAFVDFFYHPPGRRIQRILLPHAHLGDNPDVVFIATDLKKAKNDPEESIEFHNDLFKSKGITSITEVVPMKKLSKEHTQFEEKRKLVNRVDAILVDSKLTHRISGVLPWKILQKKAPISVRMHVEKDLHKEVANALKKTPVILRPNSLSVAIRVGHTGMSVKALIDNFFAVGKALCDEKCYPGGRPNIRQIHAKTPKSSSYPVYVSVATRNAVALPKAVERKKKSEVVEGEVTTAGVTVAVHPSGEVQIKSKDVDLNETEHDTSPKKKKAKKAVPEEESDDDVDDSDVEGDSDDDLDPEEVKKFLSENQADDDSESDEEESQIEKAEQAFLREVRKQQDAVEAAGKLNAVGDESEDDEEDVDDEEDLDDEDESDLDDEEDDIDDSDEDSELDVPQLVPAKGGPAKGKGGKPGQNVLQGKGKPGLKGKPNAALKGKPNAAQKGKPNAAQGKPNAGKPTGAQKGKPTGAQKGKPNAAQKGKPNASQGKPTAAQRRGSFQKTKDSPKAKRR